MSVPPREYGLRKIRAKRSYITREVVLPVQAYIHNEAVGGTSLLIAALVAIIWANSPWADAYFALREIVINVDLGFLKLSGNLQHWINDGLMALFFFVVGLEIKRELIHGQLSAFRKAALPAAAALGGMIVPAFLYLAFNSGGEGAKGWGIPIATDIAFALGILALLGERIPSQVRIFLLALATVDDIGAILIIAIFYSGALSFKALGIALVVLIVMLLMRVVGVRSIYVYTIAGILLWLAVYKSGVHATIAGVVLGALTPARPWFGLEAFWNTADRLLKQFREALDKGDSERAEAVLGAMEELTEDTEAPLERIEREIHPWVSYVVLPLFAFANAGISISSDGFHGAATSAVALGVVIGLLVGKPVGMVLFSWIAVRTGIADMPKEETWSHLIGVAILGGVGFTVSLFITGLAFTDVRLITAAKIGILSASALAGLAGYLFLRVATNKESESTEQGASNSLHS